MATVGVMVIAPELEKADRWLPEFIKQDLWVSLSAQLLTLPIIAINFHRISIVGLLSNMLVLWTIAPVMITGILAVVAAIFSPFLGAIFGLVPSLLLLYFTKIIEYTNQSWSSLNVPFFTDQFWLGYYITFIGFFLFLKARNNKTDSKNIDSPRVLTA
jgi:competence protein ComEC